MGEIKEIVWQWEYGLYVPNCPYCHEPAYEKDHCVFCNKPYRWVDGENQPTVVEVGEYKAIQHTNNHIQIVKGDRVVLHASCTKEMSKKELEDYVRFYEELKRGEYDVKE